MKRRQRWALIAGTAALAVGLAACTGASSTPTPSGSSGGGFNAALTGVVNPSTTTGGTLSLLARRGDCDSWDPARTYYGFCWTLQRMFTRSLMGFTSSPTSTDVVPDLATAPGAHNADNTQWTYTLRPGLKWQDGSALTSADIKYGIERLFATDQINGGPSQYYLCILSKCGSDGAPAYKGPYTDKAGLSSIETPNATTIIFNLLQPVGIFDYLMALPTAAPVPQQRDTGANYGKSPAASGPYMIKSYTPAQNISFVRNPNWSQATDDIRKPLANEIDIKFFSNVDQADAALVAGNYDFAVDNGVGAGQQAKIISTPSLLAQSDNPAGGYKYYIAVNQTVPPLNNIECRKAVFFAINKSDLIKADGGSYGGSVSDTMTPPLLVGYDPDSNVFPTGSDHTGDLAAAKDALAKCGQPNGFSVNYGYQSGGGRADLELAAVQQALARVGITVKGLQGDSSTYYSSFIGSPANIVKQKIGLAWNGWAADFPLPYGYWKSIADGSLILPEGNYNTPSLNDPKVNSLIADALSSPLTDQAEIGKQLNEQVMANAVYLPYNDQKSLFYRSPKLTNVYMLKGTGYYYDAVNIGITG